MMLFMEDFVFSIAEKIGHGGKVRPSLTTPWCPGALEPLWSNFTATAVLSELFLK